MAETCPYCGFVATTVREEIEHMESVHPEIIKQRLISSGFVEKPEGWVDTMESPD